MDIIDRALSKLDPLERDSADGNKTWKEFQEAVEGGRLFLFGAGAGAVYFFKRYGERYNVDGIVDNDGSKWGHALGDYHAAIYDGHGGSTPIYSPDILYDNSFHDAVFLVTNLTKYHDIKAQLVGLGIRSVYSLLLLELDKRGHNAGHDEWKDQDVQDEDISMEDYALSCSRRPIERRKVVFFSFENGGRYGDHGKYITESLARSNRDLDIVWTLSNLNTPLPEGVRPIYIHNWKSVINEAETAAIWISCDPLPPYLIKRDGQKYIQTKHWASVTLKKFYLDDASYANRGDYYDRWSRNGKMMDYIFVGSEFDEASCRRGFGFDGECIYVGSPRSDALFHPEACREKVYKRYNINKGKRCMLFAPTFRIRRHADYNESVEADSDLDFRELADALTRKFGGEWVVLKRLHPQIPKENIITDDGYAIDVGDYPDSQELVGAADIVISDYSSIMFEPAFVGKPVFLYASDKSEYVNGERELLIDYDSLPFPIAETFDGLSGNIASFDQKEYEGKVSDFLDKYGVHEDGHASDRAAKFILSFLE